ncbi:XRE family transcriptional regulator, partial [Streptomyces sp. MCAF7]
MDPTRNTALEAWMTEHGHSSNTLARELNSALEQITGKPGRFDGRTVRDWKSGRVRWPNSATRVALEAVTGRSAVDLGFVPRGTAPTAPSRLGPLEDDVNRRRFFAGTTGAA